MFENVQWLRVLNLPVCFLGKLFIFAGIESAQEQKYILTARKAWLLCVYITTFIRINLIKVFVIVVSVTYDHHHHQLN